uniref:DNA-directed DNA polymerase n=1 Tax=viral metagenome TaxID=1070528 RepID=A0A6C0I7E9_9ZZZZ
MSKPINSKIFVYQWNELEEGFGDKKELFIECYGLSISGDNIYLKISGFHPYFYVELPTEIENNDNLIQVIIRDLKKITKWKENMPISITVERKRKLYYTHKEKKVVNGEIIKTDKLFPFLKIAFKTKSAMDSYAFFLRKEINGYKLNVCEYERNVSQVIRFLSFMDLQPTGWIKFNGSLMNMSDCTFKYCVTCDRMNIQQCDANVVVLPKVMCFDIEANSVKKNSMPDATLPEDKIFQISFCILSPKGKIKKYLLTLGEVNKKVIGDDVIVETFNKNEAELIMAFNKYVKELNVNVIIGYNILSWDLKYMIDRCELLKIKDDFCNMGIFNEVCEIVSNSFKSKAYSAQNLTYVDAKGRLFLDLLPIIKRDYKLSNYKLKTVTTHFKLPTKDPLTALDIFNHYTNYFSNLTKYDLRDVEPSYKELYRNNVHGLSLVGKYCVQDSYITLLLYQKLQLWFGLCEMSKTARVPIFYLFTEGTQIQMYSQVLCYCNKNNIVVNKGIQSSEDNYQGATVLNPVPGKYDKVLSFDFASLYPSIMMAYNIDYSTLVIDDNVPDEDCHVFEWNEHINCVHDLNRKKKKDGTFSTAKRKVFCADRKFRFLKEEVGGKGVVPTLLNEHISARKNTRKQIAINENTIEKCISQILYLLHFYGHQLEDKFINIMNDFLKDITNIPEIFDEFDKLKSNNIEKNDDQFIQFIGKEFHDNFQYITSNDLTDKITAIKNNYTSTVQYNAVLDKRQSSYKICANSMYGAMGVKRGYLPLPQGAMTITYKGRSSIEFISTFIPQNYNGKTVYGDTDSSMIYFEHIKNNNDAVKLAEEVTQEMEKHFKKPMKLEFEKIYEKYLILSKKRYIAQVANKEGKIVDFVKKGVVLTRRDNCKALRDIYLKTAVDILDNVPKNDIIDNIVDYFNNMFKRKMDYNLFVITKSLSKDIHEYDTKKSLPSHVQLAQRMRNRGQNAETGSRIEYLFTTMGRPDIDYNQGDKVESLEYYEKWQCYMRVDYLYYLKKQMTTPLDEILSVGLKVDHFMEKLYLYHYQHYLVCQEINSLRNTFDIEYVINDIECEKEDENKQDIDNNEEKEEDTKKKKPKKKNTLKCIIQEPEYIQYSKNNAKKLWKLEYDYIETNKDKYTNDTDKKQLKLLKKLRNVKLTKEDIDEEEKKKPRSRNKINRMIETADELIMTNRYNKYD